MKHLVKQLNDPRIHYRSTTSVQWNNGYLHIKTPNCVHTTHSTCLFSK